VTYGTPPSATLKTGICGESRKDDVLELNRLCLLDNKKNQASFLVSNSIKQLPDRKIIVSFADIEQGHKGTVYQAANFIYCGLSAKRTDWKVKGKEHLHGQTIADEFRGVKNRALKLLYFLILPQFYLFHRHLDGFYLAQTQRQEQVDLMFQQCAE